MVRLFTALEVPREVSAVLGRLSSPLPGARWLPPESMHITLRFAGDIDNRRARDLSDELVAIDADAFPIRISGVGVFGGAEPRALWAGVEGGSALAALARSHERAARAAGLKPEGRAFRPHVTLARLSHARPELVARFLERHARLASEWFLVSRFVLMSSKPHTGGGPYAVEEAFPLNGGVPLADGLDEGWA